VGEDNSKLLRIMIDLNKVFLTGKEVDYINTVLKGQLSGNGPFTKKCHSFFQEKYGLKKALLTTSCTDALEMCAILLNLQPGDEVIAPSYTFVSTANAFMLRGARVVFADSCSDNPNIDVERIKERVTPRTKAIIVVHYAGVSVDMDPLMEFASSKGIFVVEDAAQAIDSYYKGRPLGSIGQLGCMSFHDTKNIVCGEGGLLIVNDDRFKARSEIIWEKGTNRSAFIRGEVDKYGWVDVGSSFLPSELTAAFLFAQLESLVTIQKTRQAKWKYYEDKFQTRLEEFGVSLPKVPGYASHNAHIFYLVCENGYQRDFLSRSLGKAGVKAFFHYPALHLSRYYLEMNPPVAMPNATKFSECLIRLPLHLLLTPEEQDHVVESVIRSLKEFAIAAPTVLSEKKKVKDQFPATYS
jgi:dTDP-4-amino-4,6-dideoxygalactose transaminase